MKKLLVLLMTLFALLCFLTVSASADGISWSVDAEGTLTISGSGAMEDYTSASAVPWASEDIYAVTVEEGVIHVGSYAFSGLFLDNVLLPESLESIGDNAFNGTAVTEAHFAGNLKQWEKDTAIGDGNDSLNNTIVCDKDVTYQGDGFSLANGVVTSTVSALPSDFKREYNDYVFEVVFVDVAEIGEHACGGYDDALTNMTSVSIPTGVTSIGEYAFNGCSSLTNVTIPYGVTNISLFCFSDCNSLTSITIPDSVTRFDSNAFTNCSSLTGVTIPDGVNSIGEWCFSGCSSLINVKIPDGVTSIEGDLFLNCCNLTNVVIPSSVTSIGSAAFAGCENLSSLTIPDGVTNIGDWCFSGCSSLTNIIIPDGVTSIESCTFQSCWGLTSLTIPDGVKTVKNSAFIDCKNLTSVVIPAGVTYIGESAFLWCDCLHDIYYNGTSEMWGNIEIVNWNGANAQLFSATLHPALAAGDTDDCRWSLSESGTMQISGNGRMADYDEGGAPWYPYQDLISSIEVKKQVTYLGNYVLSGLENVSEISGMTGMTGVAEGAFKGCTALASLSLPDSVTSIGQNAFSGCTLLTSAGPAGSGAAIEFGWNRVIPANAFNGADCLETLTIPEGVTRMMASAAANCTALTAVSLPTTLSNIQQNAFSGCTALNAITLPDALKTLGASAFQNTGLTSVTIPVNVTSIGNYSFDGSSLTDVYYPGSRNQWNAITVGADNTTLSGAAYHFGSFDITFDTDGGSVIDTMTLAVGSVIVPPANPTKADFIFACWDPALPSTMPANDLTVKAIWALPFGTPDFTLPAAIRQIEEEAFAGVTAMTVVEVPEGCEEIAKWAFKDCSGLTQIRIPASVTYIDDMAFAGCTDVFIYGSSSSAAESFCDLHTNCTFVAENMIE